MKGNAHLAFAMLIADHPVGQTAMVGKRTRTSGRMPDEIRDVNEHEVF
jgi:hypothetical protein